MYLAKVIGTVVSTRKDEKLRGNKLMLVKELTEELKTVGKVHIVVDTMGAGTGENVIVSKGSCAKNALDTIDSPVDAVIVGIVDSVEVNM